MPIATAKEITAQILAKRGLSDAAGIEAFLNPKYPDDLHDPYLLTDMKPAVKRILEAVSQKQKVVIYGDYDIDGITASAVLLEALHALGLEAASYIPDRFEEGYGINLEALQKLMKEAVDLVITVDCGITSKSEVAWAMAHGLDVVVTDHHAVPDELPEAIAVINPKRPGDKYPFKDLAGVGVAFKLAQALQQETGKPEAGQEKWLLDLVALGTVCDVVTLVGENRLLAKYGLVVMNKTKRVGIRALAEVSGVSMGSITSYHLGFMFGPRMNAAGRLEHAARSLELMLTTDASRADEIASQLDELNHQRRQDQDRIFTAAVAQAEKYADDPILVLAGEDWNHGVVGIVASKLVDRFRKPTLVMQSLGQTSKGSARSLGSFNLVEALRAVEQNFIKFGGHHFAAGFTLQTSDLDQLRNDLNVYARSIGLSGPQEATIGYDLELDDLEALDWDLLEQLSKLEPYGNANPKPRFATSRG
jgi:single-stranded-DNA-specific exonuclease